jgi:hypothetical protein
MPNKKIRTRVSNYTRMEDGIKHYYNSIPKKYELYFFKDVPTSLLTYAYSILNFPQNFFHGIEVANKIGKTDSKKLLEKMIRAAHIYHMGYEKMEFQREIEYDNFNDDEKRFFDWVKTYAYIRRYTEFFKDRNSWTNEEQEEAGISTKEMSDFADYRLGKQIEECIKEEGQCSFQAEL